MLAEAFRVHLEDSRMMDQAVDISHEAVRFWWNRFGPMFAAEIRRKRV